MNMTNSNFVICVNGAESDDLQIWKLYRVLADEKGAEENYLRVVDDSGEDYLYPASRFVGVDFPESVSSQLLAAVQPV
jgi:hypothetical protein